MSESSNDDEALPGVAVVGETQDGNTGEPAPSTQVEQPAESTPAPSQDDNKPKDMAAAVRAALDKGKEQSSGSGENEEKPGEPESAEAKAKAAEEEPLGELTDEELNSYKGKTRRRFKQLDGQNKALAAEVERVKPMAELGTTIMGMTEKANLTREDLNTGFNVMSLMRNNPVRAYEVLTPIYQTLCDIVGVKLPTDLQEKVTKGEITQENAQELSRLRAATGIAASTAKEQEERATKAAETTRAEEVKTLVVNVGTAVSNWENQKKKSDPDYALKANRILESIELELSKREKTGKLPTTVEDAVAMCDAVKAKVDAELKKILPKKNTPIDHVAGNGAMNGSKPVPTSSRDAIVQSLGH